MFETFVINFKFQSDSINTTVTGKEAALNIYFKFQSDSINTDTVLDQIGLDSTLNSNLILLIRGDCMKDNLYLIL